MSSLRAGIRLIRCEQPCLKMEVLSINLTQTLFAHCRAPRKCLHGRLVQPAAQRPTAKHAAAQRPTANNRPQSRAVVGRLPRRTFARLLRMIRHIPLLTSRTMPLRRTTVHTMRLSKTSATNREQQGPPHCAFILKPEPYELKIVVHPNKGGPCGFEFHFGEGRFIWCWKEFVAAFRDGDIDFLCDGDHSGGLAPLVRSGGLVACFISPKPNSYDMKRHRADAMTSKRDNTARQFGSRLPEWDFVLVRADGSQVRLHPSFTTTKVACFAAEGHQRPVEVPCRRFRRE